jgi:hypothetical protein
MVYENLIKDIYFFTIMITIIQFMYWFNSVKLFTSPVYFILFLLHLIIALLFYHLIFIVIINYKKNEVI